MKKLISTFMIVTLLICCFTATAFASNQTVLTTTVPDATYTLNIPDDQEIEFGTTVKEIGTVNVTDAEGFAVGKDLQVTVTYDELKSDSVETTIPYTLNAVRNGNVQPAPLTSGGAVIFTGQSSGAVSEKLYVKDYTITGGIGFTNGIRFTANSSDWGKALAGEYSSTITFTSEVVSSNQ